MYYAIWDRVTNNLVLETEHIRDLYDTLISFHKSMGDILFSDYAVCQVNEHHTITKVYTPDEVADMVFA